MAITNHERVGKAMELLRAGLQPFVERELKAHYGDSWREEATTGLRESHPRSASGSEPQPWDIAALLLLMWNQWQLVFRQALGHAERSLVSELREVRNRWAHQGTFSGDDADRALDSAERLLTAVSATREADEVRRLKMELRRTIFDEQMRNEKRRSASTAIESQVTGALKPWREVVSPHRDVASGRYQQAEFAADLWQVHLGEGADEYRNPVEFFRRTYLTESLRQLLAGAVGRLAGAGGDPVVQLQTNFGGGKTHSMLALYHLFSGTSPAELAGLEAVLQEAAVGELPTVRRVVLVGNRISPGNPAVKADGTVVRTLWGELAWQLGGRAAYERVRADDERATSPGDTLRELFNEYGPCLVLIDEWVAYARQLHDAADLPAGSFETHFTFAQVLSESAKLAPRCLLVVSLPASESGGSPHARVDDVEVGGERGRAALERLRNAIGRVEASWRPASAEEGFEIVRRRLFEPLVDQAQFVARDTVARAFFDLYRTQASEFPPECRDAVYEARLRAAYPVHPEVFDRLYGDWSTLVKFRTHSPYPVASFVGGLLARCFSGIGDGGGVVEGSVEGSQQVLLGVDTAQLGGAEEGVEESGDIAATAGARAEVVLAAEHDAAQGALDGIVVEADAGVVEEADQPGPQLAQVAQRITHRASRAHLLRLGPGADLVDEWP